ncbi:MAG: hypothetical protein LBI69_04480 [Puniceicoccales bacterium]|jgi:hypothetical protein|nr:hypothetical protein [Puniceicoccales bacterium]
MGSTHGDGVEVPIGADTFSAAAYFARHEMDGIRGQNSLIFFHLQAAV